MDIIQHESKMNNQLSQEVGLHKSKTENDFLNTDLDIDTINKYLKLFDNTKEKYTIEKNNKLLSMITKNNDVHENSKHM